MRSVTSDVWHRAAAARHGGGQGGEISFIRTEIKTDQRELVGKRIFRVWEAKFEKFRKRQKYKENNAASGRNT
ncbi:hypothetical protein E2C01_000500 [Portunus trituberculatus]|uniref:Uncharacterized protein n=1 Tax=Portunus trituberculatus TaxID=210409 RepID=A0A5B7CGQ9_PORTR|nr:hypothetical protein [Portunus trituberculatus]